MNTFRRFNFRKKVATDWHSCWLNTFKNFTETSPSLWVTNVILKLETMGFVLDKIYVWSFMEGTQCYSCVLQYNTWI